MQVAAPLDERRAWPALLGDRLSNCDTTITWPERSSNKSLWPSALAGAASSPEVFFSFHSAPLSIAVFSGQQPRLLNLPMGNFIPIVVFSNSADISVRTDKAVITLFHLRGAITRHKTVMFTHEQVQDFSDKIQQAAIQEKGTNRRHVENVRSNVYNRQQAINQGICPRCGGRLVLRHGRYGSFYGCSNYPSCRFTLKR